MYGYDSSYARTARQIEADKASGKYEIERQEQAKRVNAAIETFKAAEPAFDKTIKTAVKAGEAVDKLGIPVPGVKQVAGAAKVVDHLNNAATAANAGNADRLAQFGQLSTLGPDNPNQPPTTMGSPGMAQALDTIKNEGVAAATEAYKVAAPAAMGNEIGGAVIEGGEFGADPVGHTVEKAQETVTEAVPELTDGAMYNAQDASQDFFSDGGNQGGFESEISAESVEGIALTQPI
jgi:hypothetical protein